MPVTGSNQQNMNSKISTIRLTPDGFSLFDPVAGNSTYDVAPGPDFILRMEETILDKLPTDVERESLVCEVETTRLLLLPPEMKDEQLRRQMYDMTFSATTDEEQLIVLPYETPAGQVLQLCFGIDHALYNFLLRNYENIQFSHPITSLISEAIKLVQGNCLVVRCNERYMELAVFRGKQFEFCNSYHTSHAENRTYYVMNTWKQLQFDQLTDYLLVLGGTNEGLQVRASTHRFIKHVFS